MSNTLSENIAKVNLKLPRTLPEFNASDSSPEQLSLIPKKKHLNSRPEMLFIVPNLNWIDDVCVAFRLPIVAVNYLPVGANRCNLAINTHLFFIRHKNCV
jgi:hypothetical protein